MAVRLLIVAVLVLAGTGLTFAYRRRRAQDDQRGALDQTTGARRWPDLPDELRSSSPEGTPTWVIFTTPWCVSCNAVRADLATHRPEATVLTVDATVSPHLAERYGVQRAPTTILADPQGHVIERLVGPERVRDHLRWLDEDALTR